MAGEEDGGTERRRDTHATRLQKEKKRGFSWMAINAKAKVKLRWLTGIRMESVKVDGSVKCGCDSEDGMKWMDLIKEKAKQTQSKSEPANQTRR
jgi:hypothetical protein